MKVESFCYIPDLKSSVSFIHHLLKFSLHFPFNVVTDGTICVPEMEHIQIPKIGPFAPDYHRGSSSDQYATAAFLHVLHRAIKKGLDYFIYVETDCRFSANYWDLTMWEEFSQWPNKALFGGSPVCWHPWSKGNAFSRSMIDYAYRYQQASGVVMAFEGEHFGEMSFYPNGALAIYSVSELQKYFATGFDIENLTITEQLMLVKKFRAFDFYIGKQFVKKHGHNVFDLLAFLPSVYSGCRDHHVTQEERLLMLETGRKVAVHHLK